MVIIRHNVMHPIMEIHMVHLVVVVVHLLHLDIRIGGVQVEHLVLDQVVEIHIKGEDMHLYHHLMQ